MDEQPKNVKDLLVEAKDASELMVDLAYAALYYNEEKLSHEVERLEERMAGDLRSLRMMAMLAARSPEDAEGMAGVLWIADAIEKIGDAASDIGRVVEARLGIPDSLRRDLRHADEITARVRIRADSPMIGRTLRDLSLPTESGMWVMAIRSGMDWEFDPGPEDVLSEGDVLLIRGPEEGVRPVRELAGAPPLPDSPEDELPALSELDRAVDILIELKDLAEAAVGLAYSSLLFNNRALAAEVGSLEARSDILHDELESWVLRAAPEARDPDQLRGLLRLGQASETICDAARDLTWYVDHGEPLHPVVQLALEETEETGAETVVEAGSLAEGKSLKDLKLETETGMFVLGVQRGQRWIYRPRARFVLQAGDRLIAVGPEEGAEELERITRVPQPVNEV
ncbi:MAG TPA: TrkA C-terminal domain-containing protein [Actinomycetota bacterium]|nr:TrkA C-terminal domain-containing protein [Actinomycetota bacterium]